MKKQIIFEDSDGANRPLQQMAFTTKQAAHLLNCSTKSIMRLCQRGLLKRIVGLRTILITRKSIEEFCRE
jgi:hypothetical protein